jgi:hypothetical protein
MKINIEIIMDKMPAAKKKRRKKSKKCGECGNSPCDCEDLNPEEDGYELTRMPTSSEDKK